MPSTSALSLQVENNQTSWSSTLQPIFNIRKTESQVRPREESREESKGLLPRTDFSTKEDLRLTTQTTQDSRLPAFGTFDGDPEDNAHSWFLNHTQAIMSETQELLELSKQVQETIQEVVASVQSKMKAIISTYEGKVEAALKKSYDHNDHKTGGLGSTYEVDQVVAKNRGDIKELGHRVKQF